MNIRTIQLVLILASVFYFSGCGFWCHVKIKNEESNWTKWFDSLPLHDSNTYWMRLENYSGKTIYIEDLDTSFLDDCPECHEVQTDFTKWFNASRTEFWPGRPKSFVVSRNREQADYSIFIKIVSIKEAISIAKYLSPFN